ncbi:MAG: hypothetical protein ACFFDI_19820 [Promethearchaeota archaeon]
MKDWMKELSFHYSSMKKLYPEDDLLIIFDIDGTIIDLRFMMLYVLQAYDRNHKTRYFRHLTISDIDTHEREISRLLDRIDIPDSERKEILKWYEEWGWSKKTIFAAHRPYHGVLEVIRWFQIQPRTYVGLNTGRPESLREVTINSLNNLAEEFRIKFTNDLLFMNKEVGWELKVPDSKVRGLEYFQNAGYRVFAMVDNEPANLDAIDKVDKKNEILLLHADTLFESKRQQTPKHAVSGQFYDVTELIQEKDLPKHIQFVWHGVGDEISLHQYFNTNIRWAEVYIRRDPFTNEPIVRHADFDKWPLQEKEEILPFETVMKQFVKYNRSIKCDIKEGGELVEKVLETTSKYKIEDDRLWFGGNVERIEEKGFNLFSETHPNAIIQCRIDFITPLLVSIPEKTKEILDLFTHWGINRFSINDDTPHKSKILDQMDKWGFDVNIFNINDLEAFLQAVVLQPCSITSNFDFPKWTTNMQGK